VTAPTLLIVGGNDMPVIDMNKTAYDEYCIAQKKKMKVVTGATHLFEEKENSEWLILITWYKTFGP
jgi:hypothetical protein